MHVIKQAAFLAVLSIGLAPYGGISTDVNSPVGKDTSSVSPVPEVAKEAKKINLTAENISHAGEIFRGELATPISVFESVRTEYADVIPELSLTNGSTLVRCSESGLSRFTVEANGGKLIMYYDNCNIGKGNIINGSITSVVSNINKAAKQYTMGIAFENYSETSNDETIEFNGTSLINARFDDNNKVFLYVESRRIVNSSVVGERFTANPFSYALNYSLDSAGEIAIDAVNGEVTMSQAGAIAYSWLKDQQRVLITGQGGEKGYMELRKTNEGIVLSRR